MTEERIREDIKNFVESVRNAGFDVTEEEIDSAVRKRVIEEKEMEKKVKTIYFPAWFWK